MTRKKYIQLAMILSVVFIAGLCFLIWDIYFNPANQAKPITDNWATVPKDDDWAEGKLLYRSYCNSCHKPTENSLGPILIGATQRWHNAGSYQGKTGDQWLKAWVRNWKDVAAAGYPYGVDMAKSRQAEMNMFINLTDRQIDQILHYADDPKPNS